MGTGKNLLLYPVSLVFGLITGIRNILYNTGILPSRSFPVPVICVGNITVGGTGKTPHTEYLASLLRDNFKVAILSRGYKRKSRGFKVAAPASSVSDIGDEPLQVAGKFPGIVVAVDRNRVHGVETIIKEYPGTEVIILDDGFQHRKIKPGLSILLSDFNRLMSGDYLMPFGRLRESISNIKRADIIIITKSPVDISDNLKRLITADINTNPHQILCFTTFIYKDPLPVFKGVAHRDLFREKSGCEDTGILLVTGIANPVPLKNYLLEKCGEMIHLDYPDHHFFNEKDAEKIYFSFNNLKSGEKLILTTEKDAVRLREFTNIAEPVKSSFFYIPVEVTFFNDKKVEFDNQIVSYVRGNKRSN